METLQIGVKGELSGTVSKDNTAKAMGSGSLEVFATPAMVALLEGAAVKSLEPFQVSSVGVALNIQHLAATPLGMKVRAEATLVQIDRRRLVFEVVAYDEVELIGKGTHERFVIDDEKFLAKAYAKRSGQEN